MLWLPGHPNTKLKIMTNTPTKAHHTQITKNIFDRKFELTEPAKVQTFWLFDLSFLKKLAVRGFFPCTMVCFSALFGLIGASTAKSPKLLFGLESY